MLAAMRKITVFLLLASSFAAAAGRKWEEAKVLKVTSGLDGIKAVSVFVPGQGIAASGGSVTKIERTFFWLRTAEYTYVIPNMSKGHFVAWWLHLTIGGTAKISPNGDGKTLTLIDDTGKERQVNISLRYLNSALDEAEATNQIRPSETASRF
jgi:hypothetical protein